MQVAREFEIDKNTSQFKKQNSLALRLSCFCSRILRDFFRICIVFPGFDQVSDAGLYFFVPGIGQIPAL